MERAINGGRTGLRESEAARFRAMAERAEDTARELRSLARIETEGVTLKLTTSEVRELTWALFLANRDAGSEPGTNVELMRDLWSKVQQQAGYGS